jgi:glycosyltransferase involved in cell wall biosynthesis
VDLGGYIRENQAQGVRERLRISGDAPVIGSMGRLDKIKGYDLLLHAYQKITQKIPEARLLLVGDGPERLPLAELAARLSLPHPVIFTGYTEDVKPYLAVLSLFVCSSRSEGVPHSLLEAMAMGLPIVSTRVGGIESVMEDRREGWLIPAEDVDALSSAVLELLSCPGTAQTCAQAARARVEQEFSLRRMVEQVQTMYRELIG